MDYMRIFKAFSDSKRIEILMMLRNGEQCACNILENLDLTQSGLSYHMKILTESEIVSARQEGKWIYYSLSQCGRDKAIDAVEKLTTPLSYAKAICEE